MQTVNFLAAVFSLNQQFSTSNKISAIISYCIKDTFNKELSEIKF